MSNILVDIKNLQKRFDLGRGQLLHAVDGVSLQIEANTIVGLVGESGSGKTTLGKVLVGLHDKSGGEASFEGERLPDSYGAADFRRYGKDMQMIFQDPYSSLNPRMRVDEIIAELAAGNRLEFREFGVFEVKERPARRAQNPRTLEKVDVPPKRVVKFKVGRRIREAMDHDEPKSGSIETKPVHASAAMRSEAQRDVVGSIRVQSTERKPETAGVR